MVPKSYMFSLHVSELYLIVWKCPFGVDIFSSQPDLWYLVNRLVYLAVRLKIL